MSGAVRYWRSRSKLERKINGDRFFNVGFSKGFVWWHCFLPPSLLQVIHSLPLDLVAWYRNRNRDHSEERTVALVVITLIVILAVPITALPIAIATAGVIVIATTVVIVSATAVVIAVAAAVIIPTGVVISSVTTVVSFTRLDRSNSYYC